MNKRTILLDLDGVLNKYIGNYNKNNIPEIQDGAFNFLQELSQEYKIKIFTTRNKLAVAKWIIENKLFDFIDDITNVKELSWLYIDDRCIRFDGDYNKLLLEIKNFKPWFEKL